MHIINYVVSIYILSSKECEMRAYPSPVPALNDHTSKDLIALYPYQLLELLVCNT